MRFLWQIFFFTVFAGYMFIWTMLPTEKYKLKWTPKLNKELNSSTYFMEQGTNLLLFSFPMMLIAAVGCVYLHLQKKWRFERSNDYVRCLRRPKLVMAPLGILNTIEITFTAMFIILLIWQLANFIYVSVKHPFMHMHETPWKTQFRSVALRLGYIGHTCWAFLFIPVTRGSSILPLFGLTSESSIKYHIWLGHISTALFAVHSIGFVIYWATTDQLSLLLQWSSTYLSNIAGVIAFVLSLAIWSTSLERVRRKAFEVFFYTHHLYALYVFFYMFHVGVAYLCMILPGIFLFLIDRYLRFLQSRKRVQLLFTRLLPNDSIELTFAKNPDLYYSPTSIMFLHIPSVSKLQWHPFTVISCSDLEADKISVAMKCQGIWTRKLLEQLSSSSIEHLEVSTEGPYGPISYDFLSRDSLVMISGGSGITPFISIIREIIFRSTESNTATVPKIVLIAAFKTTSDMSMLDLLLPLSPETPIDASKLQIQIEAYITQEHERPLEESKNHIETKIFNKPNPHDSPVTAVLGQNSWLCLGVIIASAFVMFLLLLGFVVRYGIYPVQKRGENYHYSFKILWDMFLVCLCVFIATSAVFLRQKRKLNSSQAKQVKSVELSTPYMSPSSWLCGGANNAELESFPQQSLVQSTKVHFGGRPDLKNILVACKGSEVGVLVSGPKSMRHEVARICRSSSAKNLHYESISFNW